MNKIEYMIRTATKNDTNEVAKVNVLAWQQSYKGLFNDDFLNNLNWNSFAEHRNNILDILSRSTFTAICNNNIIGFCDAGQARIIKSVSSIDSTFGEIYAIYVIDGYKNYGIGKALFNDLDQQKETVRNIKKYVSDLELEIEQSKPKATFRFI